MVLTNTVPGNDGDIVSGGGGAPLNATYVVLSANPSLTQERIFTAGNGITAVDGGAGSTLTVNSFYGDNIYVSMGNTLASPDTILGWNTAQTVDALYLGLSDAQNTFIIAERGDAAFDFAHGAQTNPTFFFHSANQSTTEWGSISCTSTDFMFQVGGDGLGTNGQNITFQMGSNGGSGPAFKIKDMAGTTVLSLTDDGLILTLPGNFATAPQLVLGQISLSGSLTDFEWLTNGAFTFNAARAITAADYWMGRATGDILALNAPTGSTINLSINAVNEAILSATNFTPGANDGNALGSATVSWADLFLATGGVINWNNGDVTITHAANTLTFAGADNGFLFSSRLEEAKGADVTAANDLTLGSDGNCFTITGNTQINAITTANWQAGSRVSLIFSGTPTVKHNTAGGAGTARIFLASSADLTAAANTVLGLVYDGTQWQETFRKVA